MREADFDCFLVLPKMGQHPQVLSSLSESFMMLSLVVENERKIEALKRPHPPPQAGSLELNRRNCSNPWGSIA